MYFIRFIIVITIPLILVSCVPIGLFTAVEAGKAMSQERSIGNIIDDAVIITKIKNAFVEKDVNGLFSNISVNVSEGRVLLTGTLSKHPDIVEAVRISWNVMGVKEVINELEISTKSKSARALDILLKEKIAMKLLLQQDVKSLNYTVDVNDGKVFLIGIASSREELDLVLEVIRNVKNVKKVVNHVTLIDDPRRISQ